MSGKYTKAQKEATERYMKDKHTLRVVVTKSKALELQKFVDEKTDYQSVNQFCIAAIEHYQKVIIQNNKNDTEHGRSAMDRGEGQD